jgi:hypothetical protein
MPRPKRAGEKQPAGRKNDFVGKKLRLLTNFAGHFRQAVDNKNQTDFYDKITTLAVNRWGYLDNYRPLTDDASESNDEDLPCEFSPLEGEDEENSDILTAEEAERRQEIYKKLRTVGISYYY